nr:hypothetical protein [Pandoravirus aubagnensis]
MIECHGRGVFSPESLIVAFFFFLAAALYVDFWHWTFRSPLSSLSLFRYCCCRCISRLLDSACASLALDRCLFSLFSLLLASGRCVLSFASLFFLKILFSCGPNRKDADQLLCVQSPFSPSSFCLYLSVFGLVRLDSFDIKKKRIWHFCHSLFCSRRVTPRSTRQEKRREEKKAMLPTVCGPRKKKDNSYSR